MSSRVLFHFPASPYSRRARLALAHKGLACELRNARANPADRARAGELYSAKTVPVLADGDVIIGDSTAISRYLDIAYPDAPRLWPNASGDFATALATAALVDSALDLLVQVGNRFFPCSSGPNWEPIRADLVGRAQAALDTLASRIEAAGSPPTWLRAGWSAVDIWVYTAVAWLEGLPGRRAEQVPRQIVSLGWQVPPALAAWASLHHARPDVLDLGPSAPTASQVALPTPPR